MILLQLFFLFFVSRNSIFTTADLPTVIYFLFCLCVFPKMSTFRKECLRSSNLLLITDGFIDGTKCLVGYNVYNLEHVEESGFLQ